MRKAWRVVACTGLAVTLVLAMAGCELAAVVAGKGSEDAKYKFNKTQRVLVLVDVPAGVTAPPGFATSLADKIGSHLYEFRAAEQIVGQEKLLALREKDSEAFARMGIADIAAATGADVVLYVNVVDMQTKSSVDETVAVGGADVLVKVIDRKGTLLWPGSHEGFAVSAREPTALITDRDIPTTISKMVDQLALLTGRLFHKYNLEDKELTQYDHGAPS